MTAAAYAARDHDRFPDPEPVGDDPEEDHRDEIEPPGPVPERVTVVDREAEDGREVDESEADRREVDEQEQGDAERRDDHVRP